MINLFNHSPTISHFSENVNPVFSGNLFTCHAQNPMYVNRILEKNFMFSKAQKMLSVNSILIISSDYFSDGIL